MNALPPRLREELENYTWGYIEQYKNLTPQELVEEITTDGKARRTKNPWESCDFADELPGFNYEPVSIYNPIDASKQSIDSITPGSFDPSKNAFLCSLCSVIISRREFAKHFEQRHSSTSTQGEIRRPSAILPYDALKWYEKRELKPKSRSKSKRRLEEQIRLSKKSKSSIINASTTRAIRQSGNSTTKLLNNVVKAAAVVSQRQRAKRQLSNCRIDAALLESGAGSPPQLPTEGRVPSLISIDSEVEEIIANKFPPNNKRRRGSVNSPSHEEILTDMTTPPDISYASDSQHLQSSVMWSRYDAVSSDSVPQPASSSSPDIEVELDPESMDMETENAVASIMSQHACESRLLREGIAPSESNPTANKLRNSASMPSNSLRIPGLTDSSKFDNSIVSFDLDSPHSYENGYVQTMPNKSHFLPSEKLQNNSFKEKDLPKTNTLLKQLVTNSRLEPSKHSPLSPLNPCVAPRPALPLAVCSMSCVLSKRFFTAPNTSPSSRFKSIVLPRTSLWRSKKRSSCRGPETLTKFRGTSSIKSKPPSKILYQDRSPMFIHKPGEIQATPILLDNGGNPVPSRERTINGKKRNVRPVMRQNGMRLMGNSQKALNTALYTNEGGMVSDVPIRDSQPPNRPVILIGAKNKAHNSLNEKQLVVVFTQQSNNLAAQDTHQNLHSASVHHSGTSHQNSNQSGVQYNSSLINRMAHSSNQVHSNPSNYHLSRASTMPQSNPMLQTNNQKAGASLIQPALTRNSSVGPMISIVSSESALTDGSMSLNRGASNAMYSGSSHALTSLDNSQNHSGVSIVQPSGAAGAHPFMQKTRLTPNELHQLRNGGGVVLPNRGFAVSQQAQCLSQASPSFSQAASQYVNGSNLPSGTVILASNASSLNTNTAPVHQHAPMEAPVVQHPYQSHHAIASSIHSGSSNSAGMISPNSQYISHPNQVMQNVLPSQSQQNESNSCSSSNDQMMHLHQLQRQYYSQPGTPLPQHSAISLGGNAAPHNKLQPNQQILHTNSHNMTYKQPPTMTQQRRSLQMQRVPSNNNFSGQHIISGGQARSRAGGRLIPSNHMVDMDSSPHSQSGAESGPQVVHIAGPVKQQVRNNASMHSAMQQGSARGITPTAQQVWSQQQQQQAGAMSQGHSLVSGPGGQHMISQQHTGPISQKLRNQVLNRMARSRHGDSHSEQTLENIELVACIASEQITANNQSMLPYLPTARAGGGGGGGGGHHQSLPPPSLENGPLFMSRQSSQASLVPSMVLNSTKQKYNHDFCLNSAQAKCSVPIHPQPATTLNVTSQPEFMQGASANPSNAPYMPIINNDSGSTIAVDPNFHTNSSILPS